VAPQEQSALRLFGAFRGTEGPGLHWYPPSPIGTRNIEAVLETKTVEIGFISDPARDVPVEALMITGDLNIVDIQMVVQYRIVNLREFLFKVDDPGDADRDPRTGRPDGRTLKDATESALRQVIGQRSIDDALTSGREAVQEDTKLLLQRLMNDYYSGLEILQVALQTVRPPDAVRDAFDDVVRARVDKESRINQALAFEQDRIPREQGDAEQVIQAAAGFKAARIARARGEADRFTAILTEYEQSKEVTRQRLFLETMEDILPGITLYVFDPEAAGGVLPLLQLGPAGDTPFLSAPGGGG
jgi:membrane protease subunit HflK